MTAIVEFRKNLSELVIDESQTDKSGNPIRYQWAAYDQGDGFPARVKIRLFGNMEPYEFGSYTFGDVSDFIEIKKFNGDQTLGLTDFLPRLKPLVTAVKSDSQTEQKKA